MDHQSFKFMLQSLSHHHLSFGCFLFYFESLVSPCALVAFTVLHPSLDFHLWFSPGFFSPVKLFALWYEHSASFFLCPSCLFFLCLSHLSLLVSSEGLLSILIMFLFFFFFFTASLTFQFLGLHCDSLQHISPKRGWQEQRFAPASWDNPTLHQPAYQTKLFHCHRSTVPKKYRLLFSISVSQC